MALCLLALLVASAPLAGQTLGFSIRSDDLYQVDLETGSATHVGALGPFGFLGLAMASDGTLWGVSGSTDDLWQIDPTDATATRIGALSVSLERAELGLTFDACGTLWMVSDQTLYEIDTTTAEASPRATFAHTISGLTSRGVELVALVTSSPSLGRIDPAAGTLTLYGDPLPLASSSSGLGFDSTGGLWAVFDFSGLVIPGSTSSILRLDPETGEVLSTLEVPDPTGIFGANLAAAPPGGVCNAPATDIPVGDPVTLGWLALLLAGTGLFLLRAR